MRNARCYFAAVVLKKELYAMGGECGGRVRVVLETVEALGLHSQKWTKKPSLPQPRVFHGAAAFQVNTALEMTLSCKIEWNLGLGVCGLRLRDFRGCLHSFRQ